MATAASPSLIEARGIVCDAVEGFRREGKTIEAALFAASRQLGLSFRRARAYWHQEVRQVVADELETLRAKRRALIQAELRQLDARAAVLRARLQDRAA